MSSFDNALRSRPRGHGRQRSLAQSNDASLAVRSLDWAGDMCFGVAVVIVPLTSAVIRDTGVAIFIACSLLMGLTWAIRQILEPKSHSRFSGAEIIAFAAIALVALQLVRFSPATLNVLAPFVQPNLPTWGAATHGASGADVWQTISLTPSLTQSGLVLLISYVTFFLVLRQRLVTENQIDQTLKVVAIACTVMSAISLGQIVSGNNKFLWMFEHPFRTASWPAKGTFTNQNHFAHFLAIGIGPLTWWWHSSKPNTSGQQTSSSGFGKNATGQRFQASHLHGVLTGAISIVALAGLVSTSRGGIGAILIAAFITVLAIGTRMKGILKVAIPVGIFIILGALEIGTEMLEARWQATTNASSVKELTSGRTELWQAVASAVPSFWRMGSGLGSHAEIYPMWLAKQFNVRFSHAECGYLQVLLELGLPGLGLLLSGLGYLTLCAIKSYKNSNNTIQKQRILILSAGLAASAAHSTVDFVWYIPGCLIPTIVLAACISRMPQLSTSENKGERNNLNVPSRWPTGFAWLLVIALLPVSQLSADQAIRDAKSEGDWLAARDRSITNSERISHLENCLKADPLDYRAMAKLATLYLDRFQQSHGETGNRMTVMEIRSTVKSSEFESKQAIAEWLQRAFGERSVDLYRAHLMAQNALVGQPLAAESYSVLTQVGFLTEMSEQTEQLLLEQALKVRPYASYVHYLIGLSLASSGQLEKSSESLSMAFNLDSDLRQTIARELSPYMLADEFIEKMNPQADGLWYLFKAYQLQNNTEQQVVVAEYFSTHFKELYTPEMAENVAALRQFETLFSFAGETQKSALCLQKIADRCPSDFATRKKLALALASLGKFKASRMELEWCLQRAPDDTKLHEKLQLVTEALKSGEPR